MSESISNARTARFVIPGDPVPMARARYGNGKVYDCQKQIKSKYSIILANIHDNLPYFQGPLQLDIIFYFAIPRTSIKHTDKLRYTPRFCKPDLSNLVKLIEDVAIGILYKDDATICVINAKKLYDNPPRTEFIITEIDYEKKY